MKPKLYITLALALIVSVSKAQSKLADTTHVKLSSRDVIAISAKVDSLEMLLSNTSNLPANQISAFNQRVQLAFVVLWKQVQEQIVKEKPKTTK